VRVLIWHGWLLEGSGSNIYTARLAEVLAGQGHDVALVCQERHPERYPWIAAAGVVRDGRIEFEPAAVAPGPGRCVLLRPEIGPLLPTFVLDRYEGAEAKRFVDLSDEELDAYLDVNDRALRAVAEWHGSEAVIASHAVPGAVVATRALGPGRHVAEIHGSDLEYAVRLQPRYQRLAAEGLRGAAAIACGSDEVARRCRRLVPGIRELVRIVPPGVDTSRFRLRTRREALTDAASRLEADAGSGEGRPRSLDDRVAQALSHRDPDELDRLARTYDQAEPDADAAARLRDLAGRTGPVVGYFGKLIPSKGPELVPAGVRASHRSAHVLMVGFGDKREWLTAYVMALAAGDAEAIAWLAEKHGIAPEAATPDPIADAAAPGGSAARRRVPITFTGRLDHRYAPEALAAMSVLVVPSIVKEAFGMVVAEGAAAGALPLVARHSGLAEVAAALETAVGQEGLFSFEPGVGSPSRIGAGIDTLLALPPARRRRVRSDIHEFVRQHWSWDQTANALLGLATA
jgi:glycosyltransferase involved in cell wall biosynthesis